MRRAWAVVVTMALAVAPAPAEAYLKLGARVGTRTVSLRWNRLPVRYFVTDRGVDDVSASQLREAVGRAAAAWQDVPSSAAALEFASFTAAEPFDEDGRSTVGFQNRPELERVLGATTFVIDRATGEILESDIFLNSTFRWSVAASGQSGRFDVESVVLHELGHLLGLGHSAIGETELRPTGGRRVIAAESAMFPIAFSAGDIQGRTLRADDVAGMSDLYPDGSFREATGSVSGSITKNGQGILGAHVVAFSLRTGKLVGGFSTTGGDFVIAGLAPGPHVLRVEPLDDGDLESFFAPTARVEVDFRVTFAERLAVVPRSGDAGRVEVKVTPK